MQAQGQGEPARWPGGHPVVGLIDAADLSWHALRLPRVPRARLPQALAGMLEDRLVDEVSQVHLVAQPGATAGEATWVAAVDRAWMRDWIEAMEALGLECARLAPSAWPHEGPVRAHVEVDPHAADARLRLVISDSQGVRCLSATGSAAAAQLRPAEAAGWTWSATAAAAEAAERLAAGTVPVLSPQTQAAQALASPWNLRVFEFAPQAQASRRLARVWQQWRSPAWRPVRLGLGVLIAVQLLGIGLAAWRLQGELRELQARQVQWLRESFPQVRAVLDAPLQMRRELEALRQQSGQADATGFEGALQAAAAAWPARQGPAERIDFEPGRLTLMAGGWSVAERQAFEQQLQGSGWRVLPDAQRLILVAERGEGAVRGAR